MAKKLTIDFVRSSFESIGYTLLTEEYINNQQKLNYICPKGHSGNIAWGSWQGGQRCAECSGKKKLTIEFIREEFEKEGYTLLTKEYVNVKQKLEYICPRGHKGSITRCSWTNGYRCSTCGGTKKLTIEFIREQFEKEGYTLLTKIYINSKQKLDYICPEGHRGNITWHGWRGRCRCSTCSGTKKLTIDFIKKEFEKNNYILVTKEYKNSKQKLDYICPVGHKGNIIWESWARGHRCKDCYLENNKGARHPRWNSDLTDEDRKGNRPGCGKWAKQVKKRDNNTCQICEQISGDLVSHHLESYNSTPGLRIELSNGITLCEKCHNNFHNKYGRGNNTRLQFEEFLKNQDIRN